ncbi:MAG: hypothetical protein ACXWEY_06910 [Bacteroidia bacterium]
MESIILSLLLMAFLIYPGQAAAQNTQYDTSRLDIITGKVFTPATNSTGKISANDNDGVALIASSSVFYSFHPQLRDSLSKNGIFMPVFGIFFGKYYAPFVEICGARTKDNKGFDLELYQFSAGLLNQVELTKRLNFRQKYAMSVLNVATGNPDLTKYFGVGFMAGLGFQTLVSDKLHLYIDANYMYQSRKFSGIRLEPGVIMQF